MKRNPIRVFKNGGKILAFVPTALFMVAGGTAVRELDERHGGTLEVHTCPSNQTLAVSVSTEAVIDKSPARFYESLSYSLAGSIGLTSVH